MMLHKDTTVYYHTEDLVMRGYDRLSHILFVDMEYLAGACLGLRWIWTHSIEWDIREYFLGPNFLYASII